MTKHWHENCFCAGPAKPEKRPQIAPPDSESGKVLSPVPSKACHSRSTGAQVRACCRIKRPICPASPPLRRRHAGQGGDVGSGKTLVGAHGRRWQAAAGGFQSAFMRQRKGAGAATIRKHSDKLCHSRHTISVRLTGTRTRGRGACRVRSWGCADGSIPGFNRRDPRPASRGIGSSFRNLGLINCRRAAIAFGAGPHCACRQGCVAATML